MDVDKHAVEVRAANRVEDRASCVVPIGPDGSVGVLVAAHAATSPRGFTSLCQRVARSMAEAGQPLLGKHAAA